MVTSVYSSKTLSTALWALGALLAATPASAGIFDVAYSGSGGPTVNVQITYDASDVVQSVVANPNVSASDTLAGTYLKLAPGAFAGNDNLVIPANTPGANPSSAPILSRAGVSFTVTQGPSSDETVYTINLSEIPLGALGTYAFEIASVSTVSNGASAPPSAPTFAQQSLSAPGPVPGAGLANLVLLALAGLVFKRRGLAR